MPRKGTANSPKQDYKYIGVIYPDSQSYNYEEVLSNMKLYFSEWAYIVHDMDVDGQGELKKRHTHFVGVKKDQNGKNCPVALSTVSAALGLQEHELEYARSLKSSFRYLIHADDEDKYQYDYESIVANVSLSKYFKERREASRCKLIADYIIENSITSVKEITPWIFEHGLYSEFRRGYAIWHTLVRENLKEKEQYMNGR